MVFAIAMVLFIMQPKVGLAEESGLDFYVTPVFSDHQVEGSLSYFDLNMPVLGNHFRKGLKNSRQICRDNNFYYGI